MSTLIAGAALVVALFALMVAFGTATRLRTVLATDGVGASGGSRPPVPPIATEIDDFVALRPDGTAFTRADLLGGDRLVGFFAAGCSSCKGQIPPFVAAAADSRRRGTVPPIAVLSGPDEGVREMVELFSADVIVVTEPDLTFSRGAKVDGYPTFLVVADGKVTEAATRVDRMPVRA